MSSGNRWVGCAVILLAVNISSACAADGWGADDTPVPPVMAGMGTVCGMSYLQTKQQMNFFVSSVDGKQYRDLAISGARELETLRETIPPDETFPGMLTFSSGRNLRLSNMTVTGSYSVATTAQAELSGEEFAQILQEMASGGTLAVDMETVHLTFPLAGAAEAVAALQKCISKL